MHEEELSQHVPGEVDREKDTRPPHGNLKNRQGTLTLHTIIDTVNEGCGEAESGHNEIYKPIIAKRRHPYTHKYVNVCDILFYFLDGHKMLDLFIYWLRADFFSIEAPNHPNVDHYGSENSHNEYHLLHLFRID